MRAVLLALLLLVGCAVSVKQGQVTAKNHYAAYTTVYQMPQYTEDCSTDYQGHEHCTQRVAYYIPVTTEHPERWVLTLHDCHEGADRCHDGDLDVSSETFDRVAVGSYYESPG